MTSETRPETEWIVVRYGLSAERFSREMAEAVEHQYGVFDAFLSLGEDLRRARQCLYTDQDLRRSPGDHTMLYINPCSARETHDTLPQYQVCIKGNKDVFENILRRLFDYVGSPCWVIKKEPLTPEESTVRKLEGILEEKGLRISLAGCVERLEKVA